MPTGARNQGLINGKIVPSVASNNLTVAIKTLTDTDPSATNPVGIWIGNELRWITGALSISANAGTNWFNSGSSELATKEIDYFAYIGYNATDGVVLGFTRIPYARLYSDFNTTTTNEKYARISTITNAASGDNYVNVGRFAATLSAGAGYTWTVPSFTNVNLIQEPVYETRWLSWEPQISAEGAMTISAVTLDTRLYKLDRRDVQYAVRARFTTGGTASTYIEVALPMSAVNFSIRDACYIADGIPSDRIGWLDYTNSGTTIRVRKEDASNWGLGANREIAFNDTLPLV
jgi:hypothetical protein